MYALTILQRPVLGLQKTDPSFETCPAALWALTNSRRSEKSQQLLHRVPYFASLRRAAVRMERQLARRE